MKKSLLLLSLVIFLSCEIPTAGPDAVISGVDPIEDPIVKEDSVLLESWTKDTDILEFFPDGTFDYYHDGLLNDSGTYTDYPEEWPLESNLCLTVDERDLWHVYVLIMGYEPEDKSINMYRIGAVGAKNWVYIW